MLDSTSSLAVYVPPRPSPFGLNQQFGKNNPFNPSLQGSATLINVSPASLIVEQSSSS